MGCSGDLGYLGPGSWPGGCWGCSSLWSEVGAKYLPLVMCPSERPGGWGRAEVAGSTKPSLVGAWGQTLTVPQPTWGYLVNLSGILGEGARGVGLASHCALGRCLAPLSWGSTTPGGCPLGCLGVVQVVGWPGCAAWGPDVAQFYRPPTRRWVGLPPCTPLP